MTALRARFLLLTAILMVPIALLVLRALESVEFEGQARHDAVAERIFDEAERALSNMLALEEARPFAEYSFYASADRGPSRRLSPLAAPPARDFVIGYFQIDPDGSFHTPHRPDDERAAASLGDWPAAPTVSAMVETLERVAGQYWRQARANESPARLAVVARVTRPQQQAGTTFELGSQRERKLEPALAQALKSSDSRAGRISAYDALASLNRGTELRKRRKERAPSQARSDSARAGRAPFAGPGEAYSAAEAARPFAVDADALLEELSDESLMFNRSRPPAPEALASPAAAPRARALLASMTSHAIDSAHLLVYRTVLRGSQGYRQGLLLDRPMLEAWLVRNAIAGLGEFALLQFDSGKAPTGHRTAAASGHRYRRRFAEPFADLHATLDIDPLPGGGANYIYALSGLLTIIGLAGLLAIYRMVAVRMRFAERRSNFAAAVSHELKTPLTALRMYSEMLRDGMVESDEKRHEYYEAMTAESERLSRLINNVLEFSQLERGTRELSLTSGPLEPVILETRQLLRAHVEREGFRLEVDCEPDLPLVRFDRDALLQVLFNLVDNALKYAAGAADNRITLSCAREGNGVRVSVRDFGPGVAPRQLSRVFEPFYRAEAELTRRTRGTGIGLALVRSLVEQMGGAVSAENVTPTGLRVDLRLATATG
jgi:signal transduction histidine kinase